MKKILFFFEIILTIYIINSLYCYFKKQRDRFIPISNDMTNIEDSYGEIITKQKNPYIQKKCCLVTKVYNNKKDEYEYKYKKLDTCNYNTLNNNHSQLFVEGINGWNNKKCKKPDHSKDNNILGSCKNINFECKDFMTSKECKKYNMEWTDKTCYTKYQKPFTITDRTVTTF